MVVVLSNVLMAYDTNDFREWERIHLYLLP